MFLVYILKKHLVLWAAAVTLILWASTASIMLLRKSDKLVLVGIDGSGTRIITSSDDPLFKAEVVNFIRHFFGLLYNFDATTFDQNVGAASDLMSLELWKSQEAQVLKLGQEVKNEKIAHSCEVKGITKSADGSYEVYLTTSEAYRAKSVNQDLQIKLKIIKIERSTKNPWGMEITTLEETKI